MRAFPYFRRFVVVLLTLLGTTQAAWALGDFVVPQAIGFVVGGPILVALFSGLAYNAVKSTRDASASQNEWVSVAVLGVLFNGLWLGLLLIFDPSTWNGLDGWTEMGFVVRYGFPSAILSALAGFKGWPRRAMALATSCVLVGIGFILFFIVPEWRDYDAARLKEQAAAPDGSRGKPYQQAEQMPYFLGGQPAMDSAIQREIQYPPQALKEGLEGAVRVEYTVLPDGSLTDVRAVEGIDAGYYEEAERVLKCLPRFLPGKQNGVPVAVAGTVNVFFTIPTRMKLARLKQLQRKEKLTQAAGWNDSAMTSIKQQWAEQQ